LDCVADVRRPRRRPKLAAFAYAFEHLEIAAYELLRRVAQRAGGQPTARLDRILEQERAAAGRIRSLLPRALEAALNEQSLGLDDRPIRRRIGASVRKRTSRFSGVARAGSDTALCVRHPRCRGSLRRWSTPPTNTATCLTCTCRSRSGFLR
jgi:hypothetical protein